MNMSEEPRAYTAEEVRKQYMDHFRMLARYWANLPNKTPLERCEGLLFSIYSTLDGLYGLPAVNMYPYPHESDKQYHIDNGDNWYDPDAMFNDTMLHDLMYKDD